MKYIKLFESYGTQKELEVLTKDILERIGEDTYDKLEMETGKIYHLEGIKLGDFNYKHFKELGQFMQDYDYLSIDILTNNDLDGFQFTDNCGSYVIDKPNRYIFIKLKETTLDKCNDNDRLKGLWSGKRLDLIQYYIYDDYKVSILHELQHAYDDWRSNGEAIKEPDGFIASRDKDRELMSKGIENLKEEEREFVGKHYKKYLNLKFEVDARFTTAIEKTSFYDLDWDLTDKYNKEVYVIKPFDEVKRKFKSSIHEFRFLTEKEKWRVLRKLGQFYEIEKEFVKELNNKQKEFK